jgi:Tfp pilus assembly protein PilX
MSRPSRLAGARGCAIAVVLWALVALAALSPAAAVATLTDLALARAHRDHAAALGLADAALAETLARFSADPSAAARIDSLAGAMSTGTWRAAWTPDGGGARVLCEGESRGMRRRVEAWVERGVGGEVRITAWHELF